MTVILCTALLLTSLGTAAAGEPFPRPAALEPAVAFWKQVFGSWDEDQVAFVDGRNLGRLYLVRRLPASNGTQTREREREELRARWKSEIESDLRWLAKETWNPDALGGNRLRLFELHDRSTDPAVYATAAENLRGQRGIRNRFHAGVCQSARYMEAFKAIFREEGVPEELAYLPHIESSYQWNARSYAGALGMWQFMSPTARRYDLTVHDGVDERLDPVITARAAARYMRDAFERLGTWPLAITSYNHGVDGIANAVRATGTTDIARIIETYDGPLFGYAGRNFYPEFLAARELADSLLANPGSLQLLEPQVHDEFELPAWVKLHTVAAALQVSSSELELLNPAVTRAAREGRAYLPKGYPLRLPPGRVAAPEALFAAIPAGERHASEPRRTYKVRSGDSLGSIAKKHATTVGVLQKLNEIRNPNHIRVGMTLKLPT